MDKGVALKKPPWNPLRRRPFSIGVLIAIAAVILGGLISRHPMEAAVVAGLLLLGARSSRARGS